MNRRLLQLIGVCVFLFAASFVWYQLSLRPVQSSNKTNVLVDIPAGSTSNAVAEQLKKQGVIRSALAFRLYTKWHGQASQLKAGSVLVQPSMSVPEIADTLVRGYSGEVVITIPEGETVAGIDAILAGKQLIKSGDLINCAKMCDFSGFSFLPNNPSLQNSPGGIVEGYLFPDTYFVVRDTFTPKAFLERLLGTFRTRVVLGMSKDLATTDKTLHQIITMASLVEEETRTSDERPIVAGILWKRMNHGMRLDTDAAVRYALGKKTEPLTATDLESLSPYNLRKAGGLPPGPISNPGIESIRATINPTVTSYFYYLHDKTGQIHYAVTNDEHNENRAKYLP